MRAIPRVESATSAAVMFPRYELEFCFFGSCRKIDHTSKAKKERLIIFDEEMLPLGPSLWAAIRSVSLSSPAVVAVR